MTIVNNLLNLDVMSLSPKAAKEIFYQTPLQSLQRNILSNSFTKFLQVSELFYKKPIDNLTLCRCV